MWGRKKQRTVPNSKPSGVLRGCQCQRTIDVDLDPCQPHYDLVSTLLCDFLCHCITEVIFDTEVSFCSRIDPEGLRNDDMTWGCIDR